MEADKNTHSRYTEDVEYITRIDLSIHNNRDIVRNSAIFSNTDTGINEGLTTTEILIDGEPVMGGVMDKRMGVNDRSRCATCGSTTTHCPGHFGHVKLAEPVFHAGYLPILKDIMQCVCIKCKKLLVDIESPVVKNIIETTQGKTRFSAIKELCKKVMICSAGNVGCGIQTHKYTVDKNFGTLNLLADPNKKVALD
jgi:DNA-directed RNA polymerase II subunit RPB1